ncbi:MAG: hypothetical protein OEX77_09615 [Candidatus Bathyarchaeota archaeon]|nr:hypothetical protein [Candidatus Bathyarchaeota archaeon]MDH5734059.1 hypothetical protein [Candidatus Bathyarchaeota archaeon]
MKDKLARKMKRERVEVCLNCKHFVECNRIGNFEECDEFVEAESEVLAITKM